MLPQIPELRRACDNWSWDEVLGVKALQDSILSSHDNEYSMRDSSASAGGPGANAEVHTISLSLMPSKLAERVRIAGVNT